MPLLVFTKRKLDSFIRTIEAVKAHDFPHTDSVDVLNKVEETFQNLRKDLQALSGQSDPQMATTLCQRTLESINQYLPIVGYVVRSTDLEGPVELQGPLSRITHQAIGKDAKLVIFSEWNYSPFTILFPELTKQGVVLVGMPCSEANNALIAPLAGHELGHNIWSKEKYAELFWPKAATLMHEEIRQNWNKWKEIFKLQNPDQLTDLAGQSLWIDQVHWALRQCEEIFCDFIGLLIFRESYLHAFQYLLSPGSKERYDYLYPELRQRARFLEGAAKKFNIPTPNNYATSFQEEESVSSHPLGPLADIVPSKLADELAQLADSFVKEKQLSFSTDEDIIKAYNAFKHVVPATKTKGIASIINAAWRVSLEDDNFFQKKYPGADPLEKDLVLNELVLKSLEVFEIEQRMST